MWLTAGHAYSRSVCGHQIWMMGVWHLGEYGLHYDQTNPGLLKQYSQVLPGYTQADIIGSPCTSICGLVLL